MKKALSALVICILAAPCTFAMEAGEGDGGDGDAPPPTHYMPVGDFLSCLMGGEEFLQFQPGSKIQVTFPGLEGGNVQPAPSVSARSFSKILEVIVAIRRAEREREEGLEQPVDTVTE